MTLRWSAVAAILVMVLAGTTRVATHVLDQYVQLSRINVRRDGLTIDLELTAGIEIAQPLFFQINSDRDGQISDREARAYARQVIDDLFVSVDDRPLALTLAQYHLSAVRGDALWHRNDSPAPLIDRRSASPGRASDRLPQSSSAGSRRLCRERAHAVVF